MKQAVIETGGKQYLISKGQELDVELAGDENQLTFQPLLVIDGDKSSVGTPHVEGAKVTAKVVDKDVKGDKINVFKFKAKKRVSKKTGHRQHYRRIKITGIS